MTLAVDLDVRVVTFKSEPRNRMKKNPYLFSLRRTDKETFSFLCTNPSIRFTNKMKCTTT